MSLVLLALCLSCGKDPPSKSGTRSDAAAPAAPETAEADGTPASESAAEPTAQGHDALLAWLDPQAIVVSYQNFTTAIDSDTLSVVFALPPKLESVLRDASNIDHALDAVLPIDAPRPSQWLGPRALAFVGQLTPGTYVLRPLTGPRAEVESSLLESGFNQTESEGFTILVPQRVFPWKIVFLTDHVVGFIPMKEIGTGLSPLTAGRDMPPSQVETQLRTVLDGERGVLLEGYAAGPLLHYDLEEDVLQAAVQARQWQGKGMDVQVRFVPSNDPTDAVQSLSKRTTTLETDQIQALARRVAFTLDGTAIAGRLQLTAKDMVLLEEAS